MSASVHPIRPGSSLAAARMVSHAPHMHPADVRHTAACVLFRDGETDEDRAGVVRLTSTDLVTGRIDAKLAEARRIAQAVAFGARASLPVLLTAIEDLEQHGDDDGDAKLLIHLEAAALVVRMQSRRQVCREDTVRDVLARNRKDWWQLALAVVAGVALALALMGVW